MDTLEAIRAILLRMGRVEMPHEEGTFGQRSEGGQGAARADICSQGVSRGAGKPVWLPWSK